MKFDFAIGNPPYQENIENRGEQPPIYHYFYDAASDVAKNVELITPARFLFDAGKTPSSWNKKMLSNEHFKVLNYFESSKEVFNSVDIKGGVAIGYISKETKFEPIEVFIKEPIIQGILQKVKLISEKNCLGDILFSNTSYRYSDLFFQENPELEKRVSGGSKRYLSSSAFNKFPEMFYKEVENDGYARIIGRQGNKRITYFFDEKYLNPPENYNKYKVFMSSSNGSGMLGEKLSPPFVGCPKDGSTETFISFGSFDTNDEANNVVKYIKTKFLRLMLSTKKVTQGNKSARVWSNVPMQDFTSTSDIDWTQSVSEVDEQLYKKYGLSQEEIDFIEKNVKEMA